MIVRGESSIIDYHAPFDHGFMCSLLRFPPVFGRAIPSVCRRVCETVRSIVVIQLRFESLVGYASVPNPYILHHVPRPFYIASP